MAVSTKRRLIWTGGSVLIAVLLLFGWTRLCGNRSYRFYGRLITPEGQPIVGACVVFAEQQSNSPFLETGGGAMVLLPGLISVNRLEAMTDENGCFRFAGFRACELTLISVTKDGRRYWHAVAPGVVPKGDFVLSRPADAELLPDDPPHRLTYTMAPASEMMPWQPTNSIQGGESHGEKRGQAKKTDMFQ